MIHCKKRETPLCNDILVEVKIKYSRLWPSILSSLLHEKCGQQEVLSFFFRPFKERLVHLNGKLTAASFLKRLNCLLLVTLPFSYRNIDTPHINTIMRLIEHFGYAGSRQFWYLYYEMSNPLHNLRCIEWWRQHIKWSCYCCWFDPLKSIVCGLTIIMWLLAMRIQATSIDSTQISYHSQKWRSPKWTCIIGHPKQFSHILPSSCSYHNFEHIPLPKFLS